jgi:hypothetical protein
MKDRDMFSSIDDLAFFLSTDGVKVYKTRTMFSVWPLVLMCYNLPPHERYKRRNILMCGLSMCSPQMVNMLSRMQTMIRKSLLVSKNGEPSNSSSIRRTADSKSLQYVAQPCLVPTRLDLHPTYGINRSTATPMLKDTPPLTAKLTRTPKDRHMD